MGLTNQEQLYLSKLVYYNTQIDGRGPIQLPIDINEFAERHLTYIEKKSNYNKGGDNSHLSDIKLEEISMLEKVANGEVLEGYRLMDMRNENKSTGFVGAVFEKNSGEAVVSFRGSETGTGQILADWIQSDVGLIAVPTTEQQASATNYMNYIEEKYGRIF